METFDESRLAPQKNIMVNTLGSVKLKDGKDLPHRINSELCDHSLPETLAGNMFSVPTCSKSTNIPHAKVFQDKLKVLELRNYEEKEENQLNLSESSTLVMQDHLMQDHLKCLQERLLEVCNELELLKSRFSEGEQGRPLKLLELRTFEENQENQLESGIYEDKQEIQLNLSESSTLVMQDHLKRLQERLLEVCNELELLKSRFSEGEQGRPLRLLKLRTFEENQENQLESGIYEDKQEIQLNLSESSTLVMQDHLMQDHLKRLQERLLEVCNELELLKSRFSEGEQGRLLKLLKLRTFEENQENQLESGISEDKQEIQLNLPGLEVSVNDQEDQLNLVDTGVSEKEMDDSIMSIINDEWAGSHVPVAECEPVIDVVSVTLHKENASSSHMHSSNESWELYGEIYVHDGEVESDADYFFYERCLEDDASEILPFSGGSLTLRDPVCGMTMEMDEPTIEIDIRDKKTGEAIVDGSGLLLKETSTIPHHCFEQIRATTVRYNDWSADVKHVELMFGVFANVNVQLEGKESKEELKVFGTISAEYRLFTSGQGVDPITLFKKDSDAFECVTLGSPITMTRSVFACPAYSPLTIHVNLFDRTTKELIVQGCCVLETNIFFTVKFLPGSKFLKARVTCFWEKSYMLEKLCASECSVSSWIYTRLWPNRPVVPARHIVEVFSLFIARQKDKQLSLSGMVNFKNSEGYHNLFRRDQNNPFILPSGCNFLHLEGPSYALVPEEHFSVSVNLVDSEKDVSIKGIVHSNRRLDEGFQPWYNRLLSFVIKGADERSFAVLHYTVFAYAFMASLKVHFSIKKEVFPHIRINGSFVACYLGDGCKTDYERSFQRVVLFERHAQNPLNIPSKEYDLKLLRYALAVPYDSALEIMVDLTCVSSGVRSCLSRTLEIKPGMDKVGYQEDEFGEITIDVKWRALEEGGWF